jgi:hypothetical protein
MTPEAFSGGVWKPAPIPPDLAPGWRWVRILGDPWRPCRIERWSDVEGRRWAIMIPGIDSQDHETAVDAWGPALEVPR